MLLLTVEVFGQKGSGVTTAEFDTANPVVVATEASASAVVAENSVSAPAPPDAASPPSTLLRGRYRLGELIGTGGLAGVYRAFDEFLGRNVAVKIFRATATAEADFQRQEEEVNVLAKLSHPNLVTLLDAAVERSDPANPRIYYVMELVEGTDLQQRLTTGSLTARQIAQLGYYVAAALELVHDRGIVHRDIKPSNILLASYRSKDSRITAKLTDFGIASIGDAPPIGANETVAGTVAYLSPEQATGSTVGTATDIYALGLVLLQCFTKKLAFPGPPQHSALTRTVEDPAMTDAVPADWRPLLAAMTARAPADRPDAHEVALTLREKFGTEMGRHRRPEEPLAPVAPTRTTPDEAFERITSLAARVLDAPVAVLHLAGDGGPWYYSDREIDREALIAGLLSSGISRDWPWVIEDARSDPRTRASELVTGDLGIQFCAGVPLRTSDRGTIGTLSVLGFGPRTATESQVGALEDLAAMAVRDLDLRADDA